MDEQVFLVWERELATWERRLAQQSFSPALHEELAAAAAEVEVVRRQLSERVAISGERVWRHLQRLRALWEYVNQLDSRDTTPA